MTDDPRTTNDNDANALFTALVADADFTLPAIDLSGSEFALPSETDNNLFGDITRLTEADLTDRTVGGAGMFDGLMVALSAHLQDQYEKGRLTGNDYTTAYITLTQTALGTAVQYLLSRDQVFYQNQLVQKQAQAAEVGVVQARAATEIAKAQLAQSRVDTLTTAVNYALNKMRLLNEDAQYDIAKVQLGKVNFELSDILPSQNAQLTAQTDQVLYQTANILPEQKIGLERDSAIKIYQHDHLLPAQKAGVEMDTLTKTYQKDNILPAQKASLDEQTEAHRAKTMDTRSDEVTPVAGAIGKQKELQDQQKASYIAADQTKFLKLMTDSWAVDKSIDEGVTIPSSLNDVSINDTVASLKTTLNL